MEESYKRPNETILTKIYGEVNRKEYKTVVECITLINLAKTLLEKRNLGITVNAPTSNNEFYNDIIDKIFYNNPNEELTEEQQIFELTKRLKLEDVIIMHIGSNLNR